MTGEPAGSITELLERWNQDGKVAVDELMPRVVEELRQLARSHLQRESADHTLQPTALVNELYLRLIGRRQVDWRSRAQFFAFASHTMRRILVDHARAKRAGKRGHGAPTVLLDDAVGLSLRPEVDLLELNNALEALGKMDEALAQIVVMRFFGGLTFREIAVVAGVSAPTVSRQWTMAKSWLYRQLANR